MEGIKDVKDTFIADTFTSTLTTAGFMVYDPPDPPVALYPLLAFYDKEVSDLMQLTLEIEAGGCYEKLVKYTKHGERNFANSLTPDQRDLVVTGMTWYDPDIH